MIEKYKLDLIEEFIGNYTEEVTLPSGHNFKIITQQEIESELYCLTDDKVAICFSKCEICHLELYMWFDFTFGRAMDFGISFSQNPNYIDWLYDINSYNEKIHGCNVRIMEQALM